MNTVGVIGPLSTIMFLYAWAHARRARERYRQHTLMPRVQARNERLLLVHHARLRRQRELRLGQLHTHPRDVPRDPSEHVRRLS